MLKINIQFFGGRGARYGKSSSGGSYTSFSDKAEGSHEYSDDDSKQLDFFSKYSNYDELISSMTEDERRAFHSWASGFFMLGQQYQGWDEMTHREQERTRIYDKILDKATLDKGVVVARLSDAQLVLGAGHKNPNLKDLQAMEGKTVFSKGSMSFAAADEGLTIGARNKRVEYKLSIPGGTQGAGMWIGDKRINGWGGKQREFMTNRDMYIKVGKTTYDKNRDIYTVNIEYTGIGEHDYGERR